MKVLLLVACLVYVAVAAPRKQVNSEEVQKVAKFATQELVKWYQEEILFRLYKVVSAEHNEAKNTYDLEIIIGDTTCKRYEVDPAEADNCEFTKGQGTYKECQVKLVPDGWINEYKLSTVDCYLYIMH